MTKPRQKGAPTRPEPITARDLEKYARSLVQRGLASVAILDPQTTRWQRPRTARRKDRPMPPIHYTYVDVFATSALPAEVTRGR